jgi:hypothetical protein
MLIAKTLHGASTVRVENLVPLSRATLASMWIRKRSVSLSEITRSARSANRPCPSVQSRALTWSAVHRQRCSSAHPFSPHPTTVSLLSVTSQLLWQSARASRFPNFFEAAPFRFTAPLRAAIPRCSKSGIYEINRIRSTSELTQLSRSDA